MTADEQVYTGFPATDDAERERMLNLVHPLHEARAEEKRGRDANQTISDLLRAYLNAQRETELWDGERGEGVGLKPGGTRRWLDHSGLTPDLLWALAEEGCIDIVGPQWDALRKRATTNPHLLDVVTAATPHVHQGETTKLVLLREETR